jgi:PAS domain S-box-containing protein
MPEARQQSSHKLEDTQSKVLTINTEIIVKEGILRQKSSILKRVWKPYYFVFDGYVLYKVEEIPKESKTELDNDSMKQFAIKECYTIMEENPGKNEHVLVSRIVDGNLILGKENSIVIFFNSPQAAPLYFCVDNEKDHGEWLNALQQSVKKSIEQGTGDLANTIHHSIEAIIDIAVITDAFGDIQCVNNAFLKFFGYTRSEVMHKNIKMIMPDKYSSIHDAYMKRYRTAKDHRLIGKARVLPVKLKNGTISEVVLSLGEIPNSTNSDKDRFIATMKPKVQNESKGTLVSKNPILRNMRNLFDGIETKVNEAISTTQIALSENISSTFSPIHEEINKYEKAITNLENENESLIQITSKQNRVQEYLTEEINQLYSKVINQKHTINQSQSFGSVFDALTKRIQLSQRQLKMINILAHDQADINDILELDIALKYFMIFASTEDSTANFKFYIYLQKHYMTETNLDNLSYKRDFIMETFIRAGSQHELNLSKSRILIEEDYKELKLLDSSSESDSQDSDSQYINQKLQREQHFFDKILGEVKLGMLDTFTRFKADKLYQLMKKDVYNSFIIESRFTSLN